MEARDAARRLRRIAGRARRWARRQRYQASVWRKHLRGSVQSPVRAFSHVYETNAWGGPPGEFYSGMGSDPQFAEPYVNAVAALMREHHAKRVVDLGCGDFRVGRLLCDAVPDGEYTGIDVVAALIARNQQEFGSDRVRFVAQSIEDDGPLPDGDICLIRQVLQHMSNPEIARVLAVVTARYPLVVVTEHQPAAGTARRDNARLGHGYGCRLMRRSSVRLDRPPFSIPDVEVLLEVLFSPGGDFLQTVLVRRPPLG